MLTFEEKFRAFRKKQLPLNTTNDMSKKVKVKKKVELQEQFVSLQEQ